MMMDLTHQWILLYDDDMVPDSGAIEWLVRRAEDIENFSELGCVGRIFEREEDIAYNRRDVDRSQDRIVSMLCRMHFLPRENVWKILELRESLLKAGLSEETINRHDDMLLLALKTRQRHPVQIANEPAGFRIIAQELPSPRALYLHPGMLAERKRVLKALSTLKVL